ncbi:hypothetical protein DDE18_17480 [Nocardioides gansuensis]|uniref:ABC transporter substrate-binding protein n=1 Tax=Nocardioides gansuensis TaxID=2138300 RepID=A0A2T8F7T8_9ACTN|nr:extracellular solute-binding protein [Nocardioides gansuensis]PVG81759.1 hypothetical protein DDE18_17480 [Nocardioides gansuensis]
MHRLAAATAALALGLTACSDATPTPPPQETTPPTTSQTPEVSHLTYGVYGSEAELEAAQRVVDSFNATARTRRVELVTWPDHETAVRAVLSGDAPDVFMASRRDLRRLTDAGATQPVSLLLDERGVDFGDRFSRDAVDAFALDDELQCMAYSISPMVIYYNTELVDFEKMARRGLDVPTTAEDPTDPGERWTLEEFTNAARFATRKGRVEGVYIEPTLSGLAPFIYSGGGHVFDDDNEPTSLAFSDEATREALDETLAVLRDPTLALGEDELAKATPLGLFKKGKLAMIAGFRDLVPELREVEDLSFDVISMPVLDRAATVGDIDGLCLSAETEHVNDAADFMAYAVSDSAVETVTRTGYVVPANTEVAGSNVFREPGRMPYHAEVFTSSIRGMVVPPLLDDTAALEAAVHPYLVDLLTAPGVLDLEAATQVIDEESRTVLAPEETSEGDPEESETE